jgi:DNA topoisomerase-1
MLIAQQLYEGLELGDEGSVGLITYMRTDSVKVSSEARKQVRSQIIRQYGEEYIPQKSPVYKSRKSAQEAHEAIRPTSFSKLPDTVRSFLTRDQYNLYKLIWNRFLASQMTPALLEQTSVNITAASYLFRAAGTVVKFPGFMSVYTESVDESAPADEKEEKLPNLSEGEILSISELLPKQHFTQPPPRYTEATLVRDLEAKGIGRPSTYATILSTIQGRQYTEKREGKFKPTELGVLVTDLLIERFPELMDVGFTAKMEGKLDKIEEGASRWSKVIRDFYTPFDRELNEALESLGKVKPKDIPTDQVCEKCGKPMVIKWGRHGRFIACSGFPDCKNTKPLADKGTGQGDQETKVEETEEKCEKCGSPMLLKTGRFGRFLACSNYPGCKTTRAIGIGIPCPEDGGDIVERRTRKGKVFFSCGNYPRCKFATWYRPVAQKCPECGNTILIEKRTRQEEVLACLKKGCGYKRPLHDDAVGQLSGTP